MEPYWVEELFPPKFSLLKSDLNRDKDGSEPDENPAEYSKTLDIVRQRISPLDVSTIKNVYERVHLMTLVQEEERKAREESSANKGPGVPESCFSSLLFQTDVNILIFINSKVLVSKSN